MCDAAVDPRPGREGRPRHWFDRNILGMGLASVFIDLNHEPATAVLRLRLAGVLGAPAFAVGLIEGVADGVSTPFRIWAGWTGDRIGKHKGLAVIGRLVTAAGPTSFALAGSWWHLLASRTLSRIGGSNRSPVHNALLTESTTRATVGRAIAFHRTLDTRGAIRGPLTATLLVAHVSLRAIFIVSFIRGLCAVLAIGLLVRERPGAGVDRTAWTSLKALPRDLHRFMLPAGPFGISNFAPTLLIRRARDMLAPALGAAGAAAFAVGLYTFGNVVHALVAYAIGVLADRRSRRVVLSAGFARSGVMSPGFVVADGHETLLALLFALSGVYAAIVEWSQPALASMPMRESLR